MLRCAISLLPLHFVPQNQKCIHFARLRFERIRHSQPPPHEEFLEQRQAFARDQRLRAFLGLRLLSRPRRCAARRARPPAEIRTAASPPDRSPALSQSHPARFANWKWNATISFFFLFSLSPHSALTAASASRTALPDRGRSATPASPARRRVRSPRISSEPPLRDKAGRSPRRAGSPPCRSSHRCPASKYSSRAARSRTCRISSSRRPNVIRAITNSTPGMRLRCTILLLSQDPYPHASRALIRTPPRFRRPPCPVPGCRELPLAGALSESSNSGTSGTRLFR